MSADLDWEHQFCLACDRQTEGTTYCSESCRLSDFEKCSPSPYSASTPRSATSSRSKVYLTPSYEYNVRQGFSQSQSSAARILSPSSSHSSLCSLQSTSSTSSDSNNLSDKARQQLRDYASSFEHSRVQRRRSY